MFYAILAYHVEQTIQSLTPQAGRGADARPAREVSARLTREGTSSGRRPGCGATADAVTLRGPGDGIVIDRAVCRRQGAVAGSCTSSTVPRAGRRLPPRAAWRVNPRRLRDPPHFALCSRRYAGCAEGSDGENADAPAARLGRSQPLRLRARPDSSDRCPGGPFRRPEGRGHSRRGPVVVDRHPEAMPALTVVSEMAAMPVFLQPQHDLRC